MFEEKEVNLFPKSLMGATIKDGGTRERRDDVTLSPNPKSKNKKINRKENRNEK